MAAIPAVAKARAAPKTSSFFISRAPPPNAIPPVGQVGHRLVAGGELPESMMAVPLSVKDYFRPVFNNLKKLP
jgi:hypothetical protein